MGVKASLKEKYLHVFLLVLILAVYMEIVSPLSDCVLKRKNFDVSVPLNHAWKPLYSAVYICPGFLCVLPVPRVHNSNVSKANGYILLYCYIFGFIPFNPLAGFYLAFTFSAEHFVYYLLLLVENP
jgi:hypothetical protein